MPQKNVKNHNIYFENFEMSFTFFSIENSISNIKHLHNFTKNKKKRIKRRRLRVKVESTLEGTVRDIKAMGRRSHVVIDGDDPNTEGV